MRLLSRYRTYGLSLSLSLSLSLFLSSLVTLEERRLVPKGVSTATKLLRKQWFANCCEDSRHPSFHGRLNCRLTVAENILVRVTEVGFDEQCRRF